MSQPERTSSGGLRNDPGLGCLALLVLLGLFAWVAFLLATALGRS